MAAKAKKHSPAPKPATPAKQENPALKDTKALNKEIINTLFTDEERAGMFLAKHWKTLVVLALLVVVAVTGAFAFFKHRETVKRETVAKFAQLKRANTAAEIDKSISELEALLAQNPDVPGSDAARFWLSEQYVAKKKYDLARREMNAVISSAQGPEGAYSRNRAQLNIAYISEIEGKTDEAAKKFDALARSSALPVAVRAEAAYAAGRLYLDLKKTENAQKVLKSILALKVNPAEQPVAAEWLALAATLENSIR